MKRYGPERPGRPGARPALRDIDLDVEPGASLALVGVNGSGKSTLLKLICGTSRATAGTVETGGRVGGVVDLGGGFHGDLTGFENIFLQGAMLGLTRADIRARLDSIAAFSELGAFLEAPVRTYSWGMMLRLGFSLSVHAEPDILAIDEALAVGDAYFQDKCLRKIAELRAEGRTLLFVSHAPDAAEAVCERAAWIHDGRIDCQGSAAEVVERYHRHMFRDLLDGPPMLAHHDVAALAPQARVGNGDATLNDVRLVATDSNHGAINWSAFPDGSWDQRKRDAYSTAPRRVFPCGTVVTAVATVRVRGSYPIVGATFGYALEKPGVALATLRGEQHGIAFRLPPGETRLALILPTAGLGPGHYYLSLALRGPLPPGGLERPVLDCHIKLSSFMLVAITHRPDGPPAHTPVDLGLKLTMDTPAPHRE